LSARSLAGLPRRRPRLDRTRGIRSTIGCSITESWVFPAETPVTSGIPFASEITWILDPFFPRSTGLRPVSDPPFRPDARRVQNRRTPVQLTGASEPVEDLPMQRDALSARSLRTTAADAATRTHWSTRIPLQ
jgi:hypothetical protein